MPVQEAKDKSFNTNEIAIAIAVSTMVAITAKKR
jgi:hypothetical protein